MPTQKKSSQFIVYDNDKLLSCGYLYKFVMFYFFFFFQKAENNRLKKASWPKFCNIISLFLLKIGLVGPVDQQIKLVPP